MLEHAFDTIVAQATPKGTGGLGVVRLSGEHAIDIGQKMFRNHGKQSTVHGKMMYGHVLDDQGHPLDDGYMVSFFAPRSYTGEDVVELSVHGSPVVLDMILSTACTLGARLAGPGEFTKRAFFHGKLDLLQAEAVAELIEAQSEREAHQSRLRLNGTLSSHVQELQERATRILAQLEADVDFPEEDLPPSHTQGLMDQMKRLQEDTESLKRSYRISQTISDGFWVCLAGKPNAGKSSFFNRILNTERAIVSDTAGTTRDTVSETIQVGGHLIKLLDTAGLHNDAQDPIEIMGMDKTREMMERAHWVCWLHDATQEFTSQDADALAMIPQDKRVLVRTKIDLGPPKDVHADFSFVHMLDVSSTTGEGVDLWMDTLVEDVNRLTTNDLGTGISNDRQRQTLSHITEAIEKSCASLEQHESPELTAFVFRQAFEGFNALLGKQDGFEDVFDHIFSHFCIGK